MVMIIYGHDYVSPKPLFHTRALLAFSLLLLKGHTASLLQQRLTHVGHTIPQTRGNSLSISVRCGS
jgi:hypothetical protein